MTIDPTYGASRSQRKRCGHCVRPLTSCYCKTLVLKDNIWPVHILQTIKESRHALNTGRMAQLSLTNCETTIIERPTDIGELLARLPQQPLLVFPAKDSKDISELRNYVSPKPSAPLLFIDSTWRKAKRMLHESPELRQLPKFFVAADLQAYRLRSANKHGSIIDGRAVKPLSTLETITYFLGFLEDRAHYYTSMLDTLNWAIERQSQYIKD